jgi:prolyl-tRNA synthetase
MPTQIAGSVYWIENGRQTNRVVDAKEAFSDPAQAKAQIAHAESSGDTRQLRLARLAYRQFQGKRYRVESKTAPERPKASKKTGPILGKPSKRISGKKPAERKAARKASVKKTTKKASKRK